MQIRRTNVSRKLSKLRLLDISYKNCIACKGRAVTKNTKLCRRCIYEGLRVCNLTDFNF